MDIKQWLGEENKLGQDIWERKYQYNGESFDEWLNRISNGDEELKQLLRVNVFPIPELLMVLPAG